MFVNLLYAAEDPTQQVGGLIGFLPIIIMFVILYLLIFRPQQKKQKEIVKMRSELQKNEKIVTNGGIIGTIYSIKGDVVVVKIADNVKIEVTKNAIANKIN
ncbi:MAG: preprotein translocase subunit YajC [Candidatus Cloacimonetes bacterium]|nr:preprotein translocase subunit YajC [Candidatus Cloacimonadota bacterium]